MAKYQMYEEFSGWKNSKYDKPPLEVPIQVKSPNGLATWEYIGHNEWKTPTGIETYFTLWWRYVNE